MTREEAVKLAEEQRARQGLPPRIEDVSVLTRIASIMRLVGHELDVDQPRQKRKRAQ
jgi:hypothetical protein